MNKPPDYNLRHIPEFASRHIRSVHYGTESLCHLGPKIWELVPTELKCLDTTVEFKSAIKSWKPENFPCRLCKN